MVFRLTTPNTLLCFLWASGIDNPNGLVLLNVGPISRPKEYNKEKTCGDPQAANAYFTSNYQGKGWLRLLKFCKTSVSLLELGPLLPESTVHVQVIEMAQDAEFGCFRLMEPLLLLSHSSTWGKLVIWEHPGYSVVWAHTRISGWKDVHGSSGLQVTDGCRN